MRRRSPSAISQSAKRYGDDERQTGDEESAGDSGDRRYDRDDQYADRKGHAYVAADGTVYFRTKSFKEYGKLSHKNLDDLQSGFREIKVTGEEGKEDPTDFVLWKPKKKESRSGSLRGARAVQAGISSAPRCPRNTLASPSISMQAERI